MRVLAVVRICHFILMMNQFLLIYLVDYIGFLQVVTLHEQLCNAYQNFSLHDQVWYPHWSAENCKG